MSDALVRTLLGHWVSSLELDPASDIDNRFGVHVSEIGRALSAEIRKPSRLTVRVKLLVIVCTLIGSSISAMIYLASGYFREETISRVQEQQLSLTALIGEQVSQKIHVAKLEADLLLKDPLALADPDIVYAAALTREGNTLLVRRSHVFGSLFEEQGIAERDVLESLAGQHEYVSRAASGATAVTNITTAQSVPLTLISFPNPSSGREILIAITQSRSLLKGTRIAGLGSSYLINDVGTVVAHTEDSAALQAPRSFIHAPIARRINESGLDNEQLRFRDEGAYYVGAYKKLPGLALSAVTSVPETQAFAAVEEIKVRNTLLLVIILTIAVVAVVIYSRMLTDPLRTLMAAAQEVAAGNYAAVDVDVGNDEIGILGDAFVKMTHGLSEREKIKDAFGMFVHEKVVAKALKGEITLGGEKRRCTILFADLRNFTAMSEHADPEVIVQILNDYFREMLNWVVFNHGMVGHLIGDAIMAHWGAFFNTENDTEAAINTALIMRQILVMMNANAPVHRPQLNFGCGIDTGDVVAGHIGSREKLEFTLIGRPVNTAARLEALCKGFGVDIIISKTAMEQVRDLFRLVELPPVLLKGLGTEQRAFAVLDRAGETSFQTVEELRAKTGLDKIFKPDASDRKYEILVPK